MITKHDKKIIILIVISIIIFSSLCYYFLFTSRGVGHLMRFLIKQSAKNISVDLEDIRGNLFGRISVRRLTLENLEILPEGSVVKIEGIDLEIKHFDFKNAYVKIHNGSITLTTGDQIFFYGTYDYPVLDISIYSKALDAKSFLDVFKYTEYSEYFSGKLASLEIYIKGEYLYPHLIGKIKVQDIGYHDYRFNESSLSFYFKTNDFWSDIKLYGQVFVKDGRFYGSDTAMLEVDKSRIFFTGNPKLLQFDLKGNSRVEGVDINVALEGGIKKPILKLSAENIYSKEMLLKMLLTNQKDPVIIDDRAELINQILKTVALKD